MTGPRMALVGRGELRKLFGVSYTRAVQIAGQADFPVPLDELSVGKIWSLQEVVDWATRKGRTVHLDALTDPVEDTDTTAGPGSKTTR